MKYTMKELRKDISDFVNSSLTEDEEANFRSKINGKSFEETKALFDAIKKDIVKETVKNLTVLSYIRGGILCGNNIFSCHHYIQQVAQHMTEVQTKLISIGLKNVNYHGL